MSLMFRCQWSDLSWHLRCHASHSSHTQHNGRAQRISQLAPKWSHWTFFVAGNIFCALLSGRLMCEKKALFIQGRTRIPTKLTVSLGSHKSWVTCAFHYLGTKHFMCGAYFTGSVSGVLDVSALTPFASVYLISLCGISALSLIFNNIADTLNQILWILCGTGVGVEAPKNLY